MSIANISWLSCMLYVFSNCGDWFVGRVTDIERSASAFLADGTCTSAHLLAFYCFQKGMLSFFWCRGGTRHTNTSTHLVRDSVNHTLCRWFLVPALNLLDLLQLRAGAATGSRDILSFELAWLVLRAVTVTSALLESCRMALQGTQRSFRVFWQAEHHTFGCMLGACVVFMWSLLGVQTVLMAHEENIDKS
eukprot:3438742-Pleurochrysis_carterae.AAC.4